MWVMLKKTTQFSDCNLKGEVEISRGKQIQTAQIQKQKSLKQDIGKLEEGNRAESGEKSARIDLRGPVIAEDSSVDLQDEKTGFQAFMDARQTALRELIGPDITQTSNRDEKTNDRFLGVGDSSFASDVSSIESN